jgi:hypothetical protein
MFAVLAFWQLASVCRPTEGVADNSPFRGDSQTGRVERARAAPISRGAWSKFRSPPQPMLPSPRPCLWATSPLSRNGRRTAESGYGSTVGRQAPSDAGSRRLLFRRDNSSGGGSRGAVIACRADRDAQRETGERDDDES